MNPQAIAWFGLMASADRFGRVRKLLPKQYADEIAKEIEAAKGLSPEVLLAKLHELRDGELAAKRASVPGVNRMPSPLLRHMLNRVPR